MGCLRQVLSAKKTLGCLKSWDSLTNNALFQKIVLLQPQQIQKMAVPEVFNPSGDFMGDFYAGFALGPIDFRYNIDKDIRLQDAVRSGLDDGLPFHAHIPGLAALAGPVLALERLSREMTDADYACGFGIANLNENESVALVGLLVLNDAPVEVVGRAIPFIEHGKNIFSFREVEFLKEALKFVAGEIRVPVKKERCHSYLIVLLIVQFKRLLVEPFYLVCQPLRLEDLNCGSSRQQRAEEIILSELIYS